MTNSLKANKIEGFEDTKWFASFFYRTERHIQDLANRGILPRKKIKGKNYYPVIPAIKAYIDYLTELADEKSATLEDLNREKTDAEIMYMRVRARKAELELKQLQEKLLPAAVVEIFTNDLHSFIKQEAMLIPEKANKEIIKYKANSQGTNEPAVIAEILTDVINTALTNISNYKFSTTPELMKKCFPSEPNND